MLKKVFLLLNVCKSSERTYPVRFCALSEVFALYKIKALSLLDNKLPHRTMFD